MARFKYWFAKELPPEGRLFWIAYLLLLPLYLAPLFVTRFLPGLDLPFHLSMADMLAKDGRGGSPYGPFYVGTPGLAPYAAHYLALRVFSWFMPLVAAHKVVVALYIAGMPAAAGSLLGVCGRSRLPALLAFPLAYNLTLHYGFVSFALSIPVVLWLLAELTRLLVAPTLSRGRWIATALVCVLAFLCHLQNFLYGVCAALAFIAFAGVPWKRRLQASTALLPALASLGWWQVSARFTGDPTQQKKTFAYAWAAVKSARMIDADYGTRPLLRDLKMRTTDLPLHVLRGFTDGVDVVACKALFVVLAAYVVLGLIGLLEPRPQGAPPRMRVAGWVAFLGALVAYYGLPHHLVVFELMTFFPRFAVLAVVMTLLILPASLRRFSGMAQWLVALPALMFCGLYGQDLIRHYHLYGKEVADFGAVLDQTPPGGKALGMVFDRYSRVMRIESALLGLPNLYPAVKSSPTSMSPLAYCGMRHIPCRRKEPLAPLPDPGPWEPARMRPEDAVPFFDYFFVRSPPPRPLFGAYTSQMDVVARQGTWIVYRKKAGFVKLVPPTPPAPAPAPPPVAAQAIKPATKAPIKPVTAKPAPKAFGALVGRGRPPIRPALAGKAVPRKVLPARPTTGKPVPIR